MQLEESKDSQSFSEVNTQESDSFNNGDKLEELKSNDDQTQ